MAAAVMPSEDIIGEDEIPGMGSLVSTLRAFVGRMPAPPPYAGVCVCPTLQRPCRHAAAARLADSMREADEMFDRIMKENFSKAAAALPTLAHIPRLMASRRVCRAVTRCCCCCCCAAAAQGRFGAALSVTPCRARRLCPRIVLRARCAIAGSHARGGVPRAARVDDFSCLTCACGQRQVKASVRRRRLLRMEEALLTDAVSAQEGVH